MPGHEKAAQIVILQARVELKLGDRIRFAPRWADTRNGKVARVIEIVNDKGLASHHPDSAELRSPYWLRVVFEESGAKDAVAAHYCILEEKRETLAR